MDFRRAKCPTTDLARGIWSLQGNPDQDLDKTDAPANTTGKCRFANWGAWGGVLEVWANDVVVTIRPTASVDSNTTDFMTCFLLGLHAGNLMREAISAM
jgi:hypothetical protein